MLDTFADARLVTVWGNHAQVAHEALLAAWPRLGEWIALDRDRLLLQRRLRALREQWEAHGRPADLLPARARLELFRPLIDGDDDSLDRASREYIEAAEHRVREQDAQEQRRSKQLRRVALFAGVFGLVAVLAAVLAVVAGLNAVHQRQQAEDAKDRALSRQLAIESGQLISRDPWMAAQLAMVAYRTSPTLEARSQLITATAHGVPARYVGDPGPQLLSRSGNVLAAVGGSGQVRLFEVSTNGITKLLADFRITVAGGRLGGVAFVPGTSTLLVGGRGSIAAWDVSDPNRPVHRYDIPDAHGDVNALTVSPGGRFVVASEPETGVQAWLNSGGVWKPVLLPAKVSGRAGASAFSPDGRLLATSSANRRIDLWRVEGDSLVTAGEFSLEDWRANELAQGLTFTPTALACWQHYAVGSSRRST